MYNQHPTLANFSFDAHSPLFVFSIKHLLGFGFTVLVCWIRVRLTLTLQRSGLLVWYLRHAYFAFSPFRQQIPTNISCKLSAFIWLNLICLIGQLDLFIPFSKTDWSTSFQYKKLKILFLVKIDLNCRPLKCYSTTHYVEWWLPT